MESILVEYKEAVAYVTINRSDVLNCFDYQTLKEMNDVVGRLALSSEIHAIVFTGSGEKAFSAGADLKERKTLTLEETRRNVALIQRVFQAIAELPQPTIAAVNGFALGGGFEWMLACDFAICTENAVMGLTETSWGIIPGAGGTQRLPRVVGEMKAKELILTAKRLTAMEAKELGLVLSVVSQEQLMGEARELAMAMLKNAPIALRQANFAIKQAGNVDLQTGLALEAKAYELTLHSEDRKEALLAFSEKRKPVFSGN